MKWTKEQLGTKKRGGRPPWFFAYPATIEGVKVRVQSEVAEDVVAVANAIERLAERYMAIEKVLDRTRRTVSNAKK